MASKKKTKRIVFICITNFTLAVFLVLLFVLLPTASLLYHGKKGDLGGTFIGNKAEYQGVITLWNIDTFEGGSLPRSSHLEKVAMQFEKRNKGALIKVDTLTLDEAMANIKKGVLPDLYSFGSGLSSLLEEHMITLDSELSNLILPNFFGSGLKSGNLKAAPWSAGVYCLISSTDRMENAGLEVEGDLKELLVANALNLAYDKSYKKSTKHIYSLTFGVNDYTSALDAFSRSISTNITSLANTGVVDEKYISQTPFEAYSSFINAKASVLLGTQRDVCRMQNRLMAGKEIDLIVAPLDAYTDLVSYISVTTGDSEKQATCQNFIKYLLSENSQKMLTNIGLMPVNGKIIYEKDHLLQLNMAISEQMLIKPAF